MVRIRESQLNLYAFKINYAWFFQHLQANCAGRCSSEAVYEDMKESNFVILNLSFNTDFFNKNFQLFLSNVSFSYLHWFRTQNLVEKIKWSSFWLNFILKPFMWKNKLENSHFRRVNTESDNCLNFKAFYHLKQLQ